jgi:hypothetical protein
VNSFLAVALIMRPAQFLAIYCHDFPSRQLTNGLDPIDKTLFKLNRLNLTENPTKRIGAGDAIG